MRIMCCLFDANEMLTNSLRQSDGTALIVIMNYLYYRHWPEPVHLGIDHGFLRSTRPFDGGCNERTLHGDASCLNL